MFFFHMGVFWLEFTLTRICVVKSGMERKSWRYVTIPWDVSHIKRFEKNVTKINHEGKNLEKSNLGACNSRHMSNCFPVLWPRRVIVTYVDIFPCFESASSRRYPTLDLPTRGSLFGIWVDMWYLCPVEKEKNKYDKFLTYCFISNCVLPCNTWEHT